jgi:hypothetical protein
VALRLALYDLNVVAAILQRTVPELRYWDRGQLLEETWTGEERGILGELRHRLGDLRVAEKRGRLPSLLFSPTIAEQGRPLLVSNLDVSLIRDVILPGSTEDRLRLVHCAVDGRRFLGDEVVDRAPLSTWARMSATFPLISPAGYLEYDSRLECGRRGERGRIHIIDAGYTDNQGTTLALAWLRNYWMPWARENREGAPQQVILLELDAFPRYGSRAWQELEQPIRYLRGVQAMMEDLSVPLAGLSNQMKGRLFYTDRMLREFADEVEEAGLGFSSFRFVNPVPASLSWYLSTHELAAMKWFSRLFDRFADGESREAIEGWIRKEKNYQAMLPVDLDDPFLIYSLGELYGLAEKWEAGPDRLAAE